MWSLSLSYSLAFAVVMGCLLAGLVVFLLRRRWFSRRGELQDFLQKNALKQPEFYSELLVPLLVYEEKYPSFGSILALVLEHFHPAYFMHQPKFREAIYALRDSVFLECDATQIISQMSRVVQIFLEDPEVEYRCRPRLSELVDQFLGEIEEDLGRPPHPASPSPR